MRQLITIVAVFMWHLMSFSQNLLDSALVDVKKEQEKTYGKKSGIIEKNYTKQHYSLAITKNQTLYF